ncbi:hypothetical protein D0864_02150 [Hortaea werneckii]|uniref:Small ribosomal subunit protein mS33 n=1 Tax=Hortaea werneckii TaxID=91943 RepID=A0A3M7HYE1_HORWE|nr:hypothetical protein D0864_02150 [Hortaea werneckii]RMZ18283.1 hypothetical protein D0862_00414 [Hortaea werneckii]
MSVPRQRVLDLMKVSRRPAPDKVHSIPKKNDPNPLPPQVQSRIFSTIFNPAAQRLGNKVLRQRLRGPSLAAYYPRRVATFKNLRALYPNHELYDEDEEDRLEHIQIAKSRGKGAPKKKKTAAESRKKPGKKK